MSIEHAKELLKKVATDEKFRNQLQNAKTSEERIAAMRAEGYNLTPEESQQLLNQIIEAAAIGSELNEAELEAVAGGNKVVEGVRDFLQGYNGQGEEQDNLNYLSGDALSNTLENLPGISIK